MYVYIRSEPGLWTVGFYHPNGQWEPDSDHTSRQEAAERAHYLNGGESDDDDAPSVQAQRDNALPSDATREKALRRMGPPGLTF